MEPTEDANDARVDRDTAAKPNRTTLALVGAMGLLLLIVLFFATRNAGEEDRLDDATLSLPDAAENASGCTGNAIAQSLKAELFRQAVLKRGSDAEAYGTIASAAVVRMENAALESDDNGGPLACSATVAVDLPPGIVASGGRRNLMGNVDYSVDGASVALRNEPSLVEALAALARSSNGITSPVDSVPEDELLAEDDAPAPPDEGEEPVPAGPAPTPGAQPSFNCANARTQGERAICGDPGLASLDRQMAAQYGRAMSGAPADRQALLRQTRDRFLAYRDRCPNSQCIADAYRGRMSEISDIMAGRWQPPR